MKNINHHSGFISGLELLTWPYREAVVISTEKPLFTHGIRMDGLLLKKDDALQMPYDIAKIFKKYNILEFKRSDDDLTIDVYAKVMAYANLYKSKGKTVDAIPYHEITATIYRHAYPRAAFTRLKEHGAVIKEMFPGVYYVERTCLFPVQILVGRMLDPQAYAMFRVLASGASEEDIRHFESVAFRYTDAEYQELINNIFKISIQMNKENYLKVIGKEPEMYEALKELFEEDFAKTRKEGAQDKLKEQISKKLARGKDFEQIVDECESTPAIIRPLYDAVLKGI